MERVYPLLDRGNPAQPGLWWGAWPGLAGMVLLGSSVAVIAATQHLPVFGVQAARYAIAAVTLVLLARAIGIRLVLPRRGDIGWVIGGARARLLCANTDPHSRDTERTHPKSKHNPFFLISASSLKKKKKKQTYILPYTTHKQKQTHYHQFMILLTA